MIRIYKYPLEIKERQVVRLPRTSEFLSVINQNDKIVMYWKIDDTEDMFVDEEIYVIGTGNPMDERIDYHLGTVKIGDYVWHIFQKTF